MKKARNVRRGERVLTYPEACVRLGRSSRSIRHYTEDGRLVKVYTGRRHVTGHREKGIVLASVERLLAERGGPSARPVHPARNAVADGTQDRVLRIVLEIHIGGGE